MVIKKQNKKDSNASVSQSITSSGVISSSSTSSMVKGGSQKESVIITTQKVPIVEERMLQKSSSSSTVTKSSSTTKMSSQENKFYSTSSTSSSNSRGLKTGQSHHLQSQSDAFLRGERTLGDIDAKRSQSGTILIDSVDLHNVSGGSATRSNLGNLMSIEIDSKDARAASSTSEHFTNTRSGGFADGNRNDAMTVESGRKSGETTALSGSHGMQHSSSTSHVEASSSAASSSTYQEISSAQGVVDAKQTSSSASKNVASSQTTKNGQVVDNKNIADSTTTFTSKVYDDKTKSWVVVGQSSVNETDIIMPGTTHYTSSIGGGRGTSPHNNNMNTMTISSPSGVDSKNSINTSSKFDSSSANSKFVSSDVQTKVYDEKTKTWVVVDRSSLSGGGGGNNILPGTQYFTSTDGNHMNSNVVDSKNSIHTSSQMNSSSSKSNFYGTNVQTKVYDEKSKSWVVVDHSSYPNGGGANVAPGTTHFTSSIDGGSSSNNNSNTMTFSSATSGIDSTNMKVDQMNANTRVDSTSSNSKLTKSDVQMSSKSTKETLEKNMSSKKESSRDEKIVSNTSSETIQVYDSKTKTWTNVDANSFNRQKRPSYVRYRSQSDDGTWQTTYKRKLYDEFTKQWRIVDEKVVSSDDHSKRFNDIPEMIENETNITTTTYTTKVYDTKTGKWSVVEEKSFVDTEPVNVTQDIKREIERDQPDLANIITTTETTKVSCRSALPFFKVISKVKFFFWG